MRQLISFRFRERWPSGRRRSPAKRVGVMSPSRVQIPPSPPGQSEICLISDVLPFHGRSMCGYISTFADGLVWLGG